MSVVGRPKSSGAVVKPMQNVMSLASDLKYVTELLQSLTERVLAIEAIVMAPKPEKPSIQRVEAGETPDVKEDTSIKMNYSDKIQSMKNAIAILPPNYIVDGRHSKENIQAICGFLVEDYMMDEVYQGQT